MVWWFGCCWRNPDFCLLLGLFGLKPDRSRASTSIVSTKCSKQFTWINTLMSANPEPEAQLPQIWGISGIKTKKKKKSKLYFAEKSCRRSKITQPFVGWIISLRGRFDCQQRLSCSVIIEIMAIYACGLCECGFWGHARLYLHVCVCVRVCVLCLWVGHCSPLPRRGFEYPSWSPGADKMGVVVVFHRPGWNIPF